MPGGILASELGFEETPYDASRPFPGIDVLYQERIPNVPGKSVVALKVTFAPNSSTPPHRHGQAFVTVTVLSGKVFNKMNNDPLKVFSAGESFFEHPGCHHKVSDNFSKTEEAVILTTMIVDTTVAEEGGLGALVVIDEEYRVAK